MKIWLIQRSEPLPLDSGGQKLLRTGLLAEILANRGHEVLWWTSTFDHYQKRHRCAYDSMVDVRPHYRIGMIKGPGYRKNISFSRITDQRVLAERFRTLSRKESIPDVILCSLPSVELCCAAVEYGKAYRVPTILDIRDLWPDLFLDVMPGLFRPFGRIMLSGMFMDARKACSGATAITGVTEDFVEWGLAKGQRSRTQIDKYFSLGHSVGHPSSGDLIQAERFWEAQGISAHPLDPVVLFSGAIGSQFDLEPMIRAVLKCSEVGSNVKFVVCGTGDKLDHYRNMAKGHANIFFAGWVDAAKLYVIARRSFLGLDPLPKNRNFLRHINNKAIEYMSAGLPVISSSKEGALAELLREKDCGISYDPNDIDGLADLLRCLTKDPDHLKRMSHNAKKIFEEQFAAGKVYGEMADYVEHIAQLQSPKIVYKRSLPFRMARNILGWAHRRLPSGVYNAIYGFFRRAFWMVQRILLKAQLCRAAILNTKDFKKLSLVNKLFPYTMGGPLALSSAFDIVKVIEKDKVPGALVECGVAKGGCGAMMALASRESGSKRKLWLFDSYEGLPAPTEKDFKNGKTGQMIGPLSEGMLVGTLEEVRHLMLKECKLPEENVRLVKGWFQDTLPASKKLIGEIAVLRLDGDWYESTRCCLQNLYDAVSPNGAVIIDDYATCYGCECAVTEFFDSRGIKVPLVSDGRGGAWFRKPVVSP